MQVLVVDFRIHAAHVPAFAEAIGANARASLEREPGCRRFDVCTDPADPGLFFLYELYDDEAAVQAHLKAPHFLDFNQASAAWVQHKSVRRLVL
jgi:(4S)-4-hydroxy-5-phosphonooxypentane-2,3-dione isomerase